MEVTAAWVRGQRFADVMQLQQDMYEGSLVRALRRTEELMAQVRVLALCVCWSGCCTEQTRRLLASSVC
jgi:superfamily II RNA helicase